MVSNGNPISASAKPPLPRAVIIAIGLGTLCALLALVTQLGVIGEVPQDISRPMDAVLGVLGLAAALLVLFTVAYKEAAERRLSRAHMETLEEQLEVLRRQMHEHPEKPLIAWELAQKNLQLHIDRSDTRFSSLQRLTVFIMSCGVVLLVLGLHQSSQGGDRLPVALVASVSGALIALLGGSFPLIHRSLSSQAGRYVAVLERFNAVGMAIQVTGTISEPELKDEATADVARKILALYAPGPGPQVPRPGHPQRPVRKGEEDAD